MNRAVAFVPESIAELCLVRMGIQVKGLSAWFLARRLRSAVDADARQAVAAGAGLLNSQPFSMGFNHFGVLQYWRGFDDLQAWTRHSPHADWWRIAVERMRIKEDLGVYHETFLIGRTDIESIYLNCQPTGLATFGLQGEPIGPFTNSLGRLGRSRQ
jgi:hypothetical protein